MRGSSGRYVGEGSLSRELQFPSVATEGQPKLSANFSLTANFPFFIDSFIQQLLKYLPCTKIWEYSGDKKCSPMVFTA